MKKRKFTVAEAIEKDLKASDYFSSEELEMFYNSLKRYAKWAKSQLSRYDSVRDAMEAYMKQEGKILPPEARDFFEWYEFHVENSLDSSRKINDSDFLEYHKWRVNELNKRPGKKEKEYTHMAGVIALAMAARDGEEEDSFEYEKTGFIKLAHDKFKDEMEKEGIKNPETNESIYKARRKLVNESPSTRAEACVDYAKKEFPDDYILAEKLYKRHFQG